LALNWKLCKKGIYRALVPDTTIVFDQLFVDNRPMIMARYPNYTEGKLPYGGTAADAISDSKAAGWKNPAGAFVHAMHGSLWGDVSYLATGKNSQGKLDLEGGWQNNRPAPMHAKYRFIENVFEELDSLNEWYFNKQTHELYIKLAENAKLTNSSIQTPQLNNLITFRGAKANPVQNISIENINFAHTKRTFMLTREPLLRSDWCIYRGAALFLSNTRKISIRNCNLQNLGGNAVMFSGYNQRSSVSGCLIANIGASGVTFVGDPSSVRSPSFNYRDFIPQENIDHTPGPKNDDYPSYCCASNNLIYKTGEVEKQTAGVQISMSQNIVVSHNTIYDLPRAGINCDEGTWGGH